jgi:hypothetical protein
MPGNATHSRKTAKKRSPPKTTHMGSTGATGGIAKTVKDKRQQEAWKKERNAIQKEEMKKGGTRRKNRNRKNRH